MVGNISLSTLMMLLKVVGQIDALVINEHV